MNDIPIILLFMFIFTLHLTTTTTTLATSWTSSAKNNRRFEGEILEALLSEGEEKCTERRCVNSDHCCPGAVCVDIDGFAGTCLPLFGVNGNELCKSDDDCEQGHGCIAKPSIASINLRAKTCQPLSVNLLRKPFNSECSTSSECDIDHGLCCQIIRRRRMASRKLCYYFENPKSCIGPVDITNMKPNQDID